MNARLTSAMLGLTLMAPLANAEEGNIQKGQELYGTKLCNACHTLAGESGPMAQLGGPLDGIGAKRDAAWLMAYLRDPASMISDAKMPKTDLTAQEIADLTAYLLTR